jgi:hypothetical protein
VTENKENPMPDRRPLTAPEISLLVAWQSPGFQTMREIAFAAVLSDDPWMVNRLSPGEKADIAVVIRAVRGEASRAEMARLDFSARRSLDGTRS